TFKSKAVSPTIVVGWATASCSLPVQGTVLYQAAQNGTPFVNLSAPSVNPAQLFYSLANHELGIALANIYASKTVNVLVQAYDTEGHFTGSTSVSLCAGCHRAATLGALIPTLSSAFQGSVVMVSSVAPDVFVAWTVNYDAGLFATLPDGGVGFPVFP